MSESPEPLLWLSLSRAAQLLDESPESLRKKIERAQQGTSPESKEIDLDGLKVRKLGKLWKVRMTGGWA